MSDSSLLSQLQTGLLALGEDPQLHPCESYLAYIDLLEKWNKAYNLSGIKQKDEMLLHHVLDSLSVLPYLYGTSALDVGTGAGVPGFVLALARPDLQWTLLDANQKKTLFLTQAMMEIGPANVEVVRSRVEDYKSESLYSTITCRALMSAAKFCGLVDTLLNKDGCILMMKSAAVEEECKDIDELRYSTKVQPLNVPGLQASRNLLMLKRQLTLDNPTV